MGYGIHATGIDTVNAEFYVIDSDTAATKFLGLADGAGDLWTSSSDDRSSATGSEASPGTIPGYDSSKQQLVFARPYDAGNQIYFSNTLQPLTNVKTAVLTPIDNTSEFDSTVNGNDYGIQIFNSADPAVKIFDSRLIDKGFEIQNAHDRSTLAGGKYFNTSGFKDDDNLVYDGSALTEQQWKNTYVSINTSMFTNETSPINRYLIIGGFYFEHNAVTTTDNVSKPKQQIYYVSYIEADYAGLWGISNVAAVLVGELLK